MQTYTPITSSRIVRAMNPVKQFSVFAENRVGRLYDLTALLKTHGVHIMALTVHDTIDSAIIRLIVDDRDKTRELLINNDFPYVEREVVVVELPDSEEQLNPMLAALLEAEVNLHYFYSFLKRPDSRERIAIHVEEPETAAQALNGRGFKTLGETDIVR